uniref:Uncharacterized protein n=1 Tax=Oryza meridionalis TaxID=40149 RepID=A0A1Y8Z4N8_9ORYZ
MSLKRRL